MSLFETPGVISQTKTADYSVAANDDIVIFTLTAAATATLPATSGQYAGYVMSNRTGGQGIVFIQNAATSTANVTIAAGSGDAIFGASTVSPGQIIRCSSNGTGIWTCGSAGTSSSGAGIQSKVVPLSSAQILALSATPVSLIASPGSGKATKVLNIGFKMTTTATVYANGGAVEFRYTDGSGTKVSADIASGVITTTAGTSYTTVMGIEASLTLTTAAAVIITNATAPFISGTGVGTLYLLYTTIG